MLAPWRRITARDTGASAERDRPATRNTLALAPIACVILYVAWFHLAPLSFALVLQGELGLVELSTCALFALAGTQAFRLAFRVGSQQRLASGVLLAIGAVALFVGLEEISYGQQLFHWRSPTYFAQHNAQGETNLHNLLASRPGKFLHRVAEYASLLVFVVLPVLAARWHPKRRAAIGSITSIRRDSLVAFVPHFELVPLIALTWIVAAAKSLPGVAPDLNELRELLWGWSLLGYVAIVARQLVDGRCPRPDSRPRTLA